MEVLAHYLRIFKQYLHDEDTQDLFVSLFDSYIFELYHELEH